MKYISMNLSMYVRDTSVFGVEVHTFTRILGLAFALLLPPLLFFFLPLPPFTSEVTPLASFISSIATEDENVPSSSSMHHPISGYVPRMMMMHEIKLKNQHRIINPFTSFCISSSPPYVTTARSLLLKFIPPTTAEGHRASGPNTSD